MNITKSDLESTREAIEEDILCVIDDELSIEQDDLLCQIVADHIDKLISKLDEPSRIDMCAPWNDSSVSQ